MTTITLKLGEYGENLLKTLAQKDHQTLRVIYPCAETESLIGEVDKILDNIGGVMEFSEEDTNERKMLDKLVPGLVMLIVNTATLRLLEQQGTSKKELQILGLLFGLNSLFLLIYFFKNYKSTSKIHVLNLIFTVIACF